MTFSLSICNTISFIKIFLLPVFIILLISSNVIAKEKNKIQEKLIIVTPYPSGFLDSYRRAFENRHPEYDTQIIKMKTNTGVEHLKKIRDENTVDLFWASAVDAFEILKSEGLLEPYKSTTQGIPTKISDVLVSDADHMYTGFAFSGVGLMWNEKLLQSKGVGIPNDWEDLANPGYFDLVAMSSPSRSGSTHVAIEAILQTRGWDEGWKLIQRIGGNLNQITAKSTDVPNGINEGQFGIGVVIDYYGLTSRARHYPVNFAYPQPATMFPANIALLHNAPHSKAAKLFIDFLLSLEGQYLLLDKDIRRLPIRMETYSSAPDDYPNPFIKTSIGHTQALDFKLSKSRYTLVNSLFDNLITFNHEDLAYATSAIHLLEQKLKKQTNLKASELLARAKQALYLLPVTEPQSVDAEYTQQFTKKRKNAADKLPARQKKIEDGWDTSIKRRYQKALKLANEGLNL